MLLNTNYIYLYLPLFLACFVYLGGRKRSKVDGSARVLHRAKPQLCNHIHNLPTQLCTYTFIVINIHKHAFVHGCMEIKVCVLWLCFVVSCYW